MSPSRKRSASTRAKRERHARCRAMGVEFAVGIDKPPLCCRDPRTTMGNLTVSAHEAGAYRDRPHEMRVQLKRCEPTVGGKRRMHCHAHAAIEKVAGDSAMDGTHTGATIVCRIQ